MRSAILLVGLSSAALLAALVAKTAGSHHHAAPGVSGKAEPLYTVIASSVSGTVRAVHTRVGEPVRAGQLLVELDVPEASAAERAREMEHLTAALSPEFRHQLIEVHPQTTAAEAAYVEALHKVESAPQDGLKLRRLKDAASERILVRQRLGKILDGPGGNLDRLTQRLRDHTSLRAGADSIIEMVEVQPGGRVEPGQPLAVLRVLGAYRVDFVPPTDGASALRAGSVIPAWVQGRRVEATVDSVTERHVPFGFRRHREVRNETVVSLRFYSAEPLAPGTEVSLETR